MIEYLETAIEAARQAGALLKEKFGKQLEIEKKGEINLVTDADRASENLIKEIILSKYPSHGFKAEEGTEIQLNSDFLWLADPLDGTTNFAHGFPVYSVSIALKKGVDLLVGCVYNPNLDECFAAERGAGAYLNGNRIQVSQTLNLTNSFMATGFPYDIRESSENNIAEFAAFSISSQAIRRPGSAALDLSYLACGRFDGYWEQKLSPWDIAAGILLVEEAGGIVTDYCGKPFDLFKGQIAASNGKIHGEMIELLRYARKSR
jgi:myo-inositol-1(or 4)-monophosphatase